MRQTLMLLLVAGTATVCQADDPREALDAIREKLGEIDARIEGVSIVATDIEERLYGPGFDVVVTASGGELGQRPTFAETVRRAFESEPEWETWLEEYGLVVRFTDPPSDMEFVEPVPISPIDAPHVAALMKEVQSRIETSEVLNGALIQGVEMQGRPDGDGRLLVLRGVVRMEQQMDPLVEVVDGVLADSAYWRTRRDAVFPWLGEMEIAPSDQEVGVQSYRIGLDEFWNGSLVDAERAFTRAIAEDPLLATYRYWKVVALLALGEDVRAVRLLDVLLAQNPEGQRDPAIARELERVQGCLRQKLFTYERDLVVYGGVTVLEDTDDGALSEKPVIHIPRVPVDRLRVPPPPVPAVDVPRADVENRPQGTTGGPGDPPPPAPPGGVETTPDSGSQPGL